MQKTKIDFIVFDWDGTLSDSISVIVKSIREACRESNLPDPGEEKSRYIIGMGLKPGLEHILPDVGSKDLTRMVKKYRDIWLENSKEIRLFDGADTMIRKLQERKIPMAVATGKSRAGLERAFDSTGLRDAFITSRCADETEPKPAPDMILEIAEELKLPAESAVMIGDTSHDLLMAQAANSKAVFVEWGAHSKDLVSTCPREKDVATMRELEEWLIDAAS